MKYCKAFSFGMVCALLLAACNYKTIADAEYPAQRVYIAAASYGTVYGIESIPVHSSNTPTEGTPFRFTVDLDNDLFNIPISVYRSGIDNKGAVEVAITPNSDTVSKLIAAGTLEGAELLAASEYTIPASVTIPDGSAYGTFTVPVKLEYLLANAPDRKFAFGFGIECSSRECNPDYDALVVAIDTKIMVPTADFSYQADANAWNNIIFKNSSANIVASEWDFGDGTTSTATNPSHKYAEQGSYDVTLTTTGVTGDKKSKTIKIPVLFIEKLDKSEWSIAEAGTEEPQEGNGNGLAKAAIDDDTATYWHSQWSPNNAPHPHSFTVDMGREYTIANFTCVRRLGDARGQTECKIYTSIDNVNWDDRGTFEVNPDSDDPQTLTMPELKKARYFKYESTKSRQGFSFLAEISAYGSKE